MTTIRETTGTSGRMLVAGTVYAVQFPASEYHDEEWRIVPRLDMPQAVVRTEDAARAWLEYLANLTQGPGHA